MPFPIDPGVGHSGDGRWFYNAYLSRKATHFQTHERLALIIIRNAIIRDPDLFAVSGTVLRSLDGTIASLP